MQWKHATLAAQILVPHVLSVHYEFDRGNFNLQAETEPGKFETFLSIASVVDFVLTERDNKKKGCPNP